MAEFKQVVAAAYRRQSIWGWPIRIMITSEHIRHRSGGGLAVQKLARVLQIGVLSLCVAALGGCGGLSGTGIGGTPGIGSGGGSAGGLGIGAWIITLH